MSKGGRNNAEAAPMSFREKAKLPEEDFRKKPTSLVYLSEHGASLSVEDGTLLDESLQAYARKQYYDDKLVREIYEAQRLDGLLLTARNETALLAKAQYLKDNPDPLYGERARAPSEPSATARSAQIKEQKRAQTHVLNTLSDQLVVIEERQGVLEATTETVVRLINELRHRRRKYLDQMKASEARERKMGQDIRSLASYVEEQLDQRDRAARQLKRLREDASHEAAEAKVALGSLAREQASLESEAEAMRARAEAAEQAHRRKWHTASYDTRKVDERRKLRYGYVRAQVQGWRAEFDTMLDTAQVRRPSYHDPESTGWPAAMAELLVSAIRDRELQTASLLSHYHRILQPQQAALARDLDALETYERHVAAAAAAAAAAEAAEAAGAAAGGGAAAAAAPAGGGGGERRRRAAGLQATLDEVLPKLAALAKWLASDAGGAGAAGSLRGTQSARWVEGLAEGLVEGQAAAPATAAVAAEVWELKDGGLAGEYYVNKLDGRTSWERPPPATASPVVDAAGSGGGGDAAGGGGSPASMRAHRPAPQRPPNVEATLGRIHARVQALRLRAHALCAARVELDVVRGGAPAPAPAAASAAEAEAAEAAAAAAGARGVLEQWSAPADADAAALEGRGELDRVQHYLPPTVFAPQASFGRGDSFITPVEPAVAMAHLRQAVAKTTVMVADGEAEAEAEADYERRFVELAQLGSPKGAAPTRAWAEAGAAE